MDTLINNSGLIKFQIDCDNSNSAEEDCASKKKTTAADKENINRELLPLNLNSCTSTNCSVFCSDKTILLLGTDDDELHQEDACDFKPKLKLNWSTDFYEHDRHYEGGGNLAPPRAYEYRQLYQVKKERAIKQREEDERKARQFHSRPVPNFKVLHKRIEDMVVIHRITVPITPETMKHSHAHKEQRMRKEQDVQSEVPSSDGTRKQRLETKSFQLNANKRVRVGREFDAVVKINMAEKKCKVNVSCAMNKNQILLVSRITLWLCDGVRALHLQTIYR